MAVAIVGNVLIAVIVIDGFSGPSPANREFGTPNVEVPISDSLPHPVPQNGPRIGFSGGPPARIDLLFARLDPDTQEASITARITIPTSLLLALPGRGGHRAVAGSAGAFHLTRHGIGLGLPLKFLPGYAGASGYETVVPLSRLIRSANSSSSLTIDFDLPLQGQPSAFPGDWYELASSVVLWPPTSWALVYRGVGQPGVPVHLSLAAGPAMRGYSISMVSRPKVDAGFLRLVVVTNGQTKTLAYVIASVPILLAIVALALLVSGLLGGYNPIRLQELAFTIVLGLLAVLPIRQVAVPDNLHGFTRVDLLLAFGVTLSVGVLLLALAAQIGLRRGFMEGAAEASPATGASSPPRR